MLPRLGLPDWTVTFLIILLIVGFPITIILSWIFDITGEGIKKTETLEEIGEEESHQQIVRRRFRVSDGIIAVLFIVVCILLYPKIFNKDKFKNIRDEDDRISIAVMPFKNLTGDTLLNVWQEGLQNLLIASLSNSEELSVRQYETMYNIFGSKEDMNYASITPSLAREVALKLEANTLIVGSIHQSGNVVRITTNLLDSKSEEIYKSYIVDGDSEEDFFSITDSLSMLVKNYLEIKMLDQAMFYDLKNAFTKSTEAYKYYIQGYSHHGRLEYREAIDLYLKAIAIDTNFVSAMLKLSYSYGDIGLTEQSKLWAYKAFSKINMVPPEIQLSIREVKAAIDKKPEDLIQCTKQYLEIDPYCANKMYVIGWAYFNTEQWQNAIDAFENNIALLKQFDRKSWIWTYILLGRAYHEIRAHKKERKIYEEGLTFWPNAKYRIVHRQAICALSQGDTIEANKYHAEFKILGEQNGWSESEIIYWLASAYDQVHNYEQAEKLYRKALVLNPQHFDAINSLAYLLISNDIDIDEGNELIKGVLEIESDNGDYLFTYGLGLYKQGNLTEAQEVLKTAWDLIAYYDHEKYLHMQEVEQALASQSQ